MADIFISYSKAERTLTEALARELEAVGYSVWWDTNLIAGESYQKVIVRELEEARAVIVIWTPSSTQSEWVYSEANRAARQEKLISVRVAEVDMFDIPPPFDVRQTEFLDNRRAIWKALEQLGIRPIAKEIPAQTIEVATPSAPRPPDSVAASSAPSEPVPLSPVGGAKTSSDSERAPAEASRSGTVEWKVVEPYWSRTRQAAMTGIIIWGFLAFGIPAVAADLNQLRLFGFPLGYYLTAQGSILGFLATLLWFMRRQGHLDRNAVAHN